MKVYPFLSTSDLNLYITNLLFPDSWLYYYLFIIVIIITSLLFLIAWQWKPTIQGLNIRLCSRETRIFLMLQFLANQQSTCVVDLCTNNDVSYTFYRSTTRSPLVFKVVPKGVVFAARQVTMMVLAASLCFSAISLVTSRLSPFKVCLSFSATLLATINHH